MKQRKQRSLGRGAYLTAVLLCGTPLEGFFPTTTTTALTRRRVPLVAHGVHIMHRTTRRNTQSCTVMWLKNERGPAKSVKSHHDQQEVVVGSKKIRGSKKSVTEVPSTSKSKGSVKRKSSKKKTKKSSKTSKNEDPIHWRVETDEFVHRTESPPINGDTSLASRALLRFTVRGNPLPLRRHRTARGFVYNPSAKAQESFRMIVQEMVFPHIDPTVIVDDDDDDNSNTPEPLFPETHALAMTIVFNMKRPKKHFVNNTPGPGRLRATAPPQAAPTLRTDVDNLAKFVLDSLNGLLYVDDRQIVSLHVTKLYDMQDECQGSTHVSLRVMGDDKDIEELLDHSMALFH